MLSSSPNRFRVSGLVFKTIQQDHVRSISFEHVLDCVSKGEDVAFWIELGNVVD